jgi:hypothetical protein
MRASSLAILSNTTAAISQDINSGKNGSNSVRFNSSKMSLRGKK